MSYNHGIRVNENSTTLSEPDQVTSGIQIVFGIAPVNLLDEPGSATNKLFMCNTWDEAKRLIGYTEDSTFTLCQSMDASFKLYGVSPVIFCNVLNPEVHKKKNEDAEFTIENGKVFVDTKGILLSSIVIKAGESATELVSGEDYISSFDKDGNVIISFLASQTGKVTISSESIDPSAVTSSDIIGSVNASDNSETGLELIRQVYPRFGVVPGMIIAPGFSSDSNVAAALVSKCQDINGKFKCECCIDLDDTDATDYTKCNSAKKNAYLNSERQIVLWPKVLIQGKIYHYSVVYAALTASSDFANGDMPDICSNRVLNISSTVLSDGTEIVLDEPQANVLNSYGIVTAINQNGWRTWGNNTAAYPENKDPKDRWINCRRFFSWWGNSFILNYLSKVDNPTNFRLIESIVDSENIRGNSFVAQNKCAGAKITYNKDDNPIESILNGKIKFKQYLAPYIPAEYIENTLEFDPSMIESSLGGE